MIVLLIVSFVPVSGQSNPAGTAFSYQCHTTGISFFHPASDSVFVTFESINYSLNNARTLGRNLLIGAATNIGVYALQSNEIQVNLHNQSAVNFQIYPPSICPVPETATTPDINVQSQAFAYASYTGGLAVAFSGVLADGTAFAYALSGNGAYAIAVAGMARNIYVIQPGDTLYSIALRYNTTVAAIAALNNIPDPDDIEAGQEILIP